MSEHKASVTWKRSTPDFTYEGYDRTHVWRFEGGTTVTASGAPEYRGNPDLVDPEAAFAASLSSCHLLTFLAIAARKRFTVDSYDDHAVATLEKNPEGTLCITRVVLRPLVTFGGERTPDEDEIRKLHERAHALCFIANSVRSEVVVEPVFGAG